MHERGRKAGVQSELEIELMRARGELRLAEQRAD